MPVRCGAARRIFAGVLASKPIARVPSTRAHSPTHDAAHDDPHHRAPADNMVDVPLILQSQAQEPGLGPAEDAAPWAAAPLCPPWRWQRALGGGEGLPAAASLHGVSAMGTHAGRLWRAFVGVLSA